MVDSPYRGPTPVPQPDKRLNAAQVQALRDLHRKVKGSYLQLTQLLDELDLLMRTV